MFELGKSYKTQEDKVVKIIKETNVGTNYHQVQGDDDIWRYARKSDAGRVTASDFDMSYPKNLVVGSEIS